MRSLVVRSPGSGPGGRAVRTTAIRTDPTPALSHAGAGINATAADPRTRFDPARPSSARPIGAATSMHGHSSS